MKKEKEIYDLFMEEVEASKKTHKDSMDYNQKLKKDSGKNRLDLVPPEWILEIGKVLSFGIQKGYEEDSWMQVEAKRYKASTLRHLLAHLDGELLDPESGLMHLSHVLTNVGFLLTLKKLEMDKARI